MSVQKEEKAVSYNLVIDRERDKILTSLLFAVYKNQDAKEYFDECIESYGINRDEVVKFLQEKSDKNHELDWCNDPNCKYKKSK